MVYVLARNTVVWNPRLKLCPLLEPHLYTPAPLLSLFLDLSVYQTRPPFIFCHSHLSGNLTVNGLWNAYVCIITAGDHITNVYETTDKVIKALMFSQHSIPRFL
jgi:hypothetical protein